MRELRTERLLYRVVPPDIVIPGGLPHDERVAGDFLNGGYSLRKEASRTEFEPICILQCAQRIRCASMQHHALACEVPILPCNLDRRPRYKSIVDPELSRVQPPRRVCN